MQTLKVDVAVIGSGTAGLNARRQVEKEGRSVVLVESGAYGTMCAREGCMPSKVLIAAADAAHEVAQAGLFGIRVPQGVAVDGPAVLARVRRERDRFAGFAARDTEALPAAKRLRGRARFVGPSVLEVLPPEGQRGEPPHDQVVGGVGNLRRLVALPVVVEQGSCDWPDVARDLDEAAIRFLRDWKGYEPVRPASPDGACTLAHQLGTWQEKAPGAGKPPADLRARLMVAGEEAAADGVLVVHASPECPGGADAGLLTLPARLAGSLNRSLSAGVYEAERGTFVWHNHIRPPGWDPGRYGAQPPPRFETRQAGESQVPGQPVQGGIGL